jgi:hypothetical protein
MKVLGIFLLLFASCILLSIGLDLILGKSFWESILGLYSSFGVLRKAELPILIFFLLLNFLPPYLDYRKNKKTYQ